MKYVGKEKCRVLRRIRAEIARRNNIAWTEEECTYEGDCKGTCPKCEAEVRQLEHELENLAARGDKVHITGVAERISLSITDDAASQDDTNTDYLDAICGEFERDMDTSGDWPVADRPYEEPPDDVWDSDNPSTDIGELEGAMAAPNDWGDDEW